MFHPAVLPAACVLLLALPATAATIIRANSPGSNGMGASNGPVVQTFGDNISLAAPGNAVFETSIGVGGTLGTPDIDLTWSATGSSTGRGWEYHTWGGAGAANSGGGVMQMDGSGIGSTYSITFTPGSPTTAVILNSFNFIGDTNGDTYQYRVDIVNLSLNSTAATSTTAAWTTAVAQNPSNTDPDVWAGAPGVVLGFTGSAGVAYRLDLVRVGTSNGAGSNVDIAIDNISFDQVTIPEPGAASLALLGLLGMMARRR